MLMSTSMSSLLSVGVVRSRSRSEVREQRTRRSSSDVDPPASPLLLSDPLSSR